MPQPHTNIEEFLARHSQSNFRYKDELFSLLASDAAACEANSSIASCARLLKIYRRRADLLRRYETPHAQQLHDDVLALCGALATTPDEHCQLGRFHHYPTQTTRSSKALGLAAFLVACLRRTNA
jgi:predicted component of type VI protein secretion system